MSTDPCTSSIVSDCGAVHILRNRIVIAYYSWVVLGPHSVDAWSYGRVGYRLPAPPARPLPDPAARLCTVGPCRPAPAPEPQPSAAARPIPAARSRRFHGWVTVPYCPAGVRPGVTVYGILLCTSRSLPPHAAAQPPCPKPDECLNLMRCSSEIARAAYLTLGPLSAVALVVHLLVTCGSGSSRAPFLRGAAPSLPAFSS